MTAALFGILMAALIALAIALFASLRFEQVEQGKEVVIFRLGRFLRVDGPGLVKLLRGADQIKHVIDTRDKIHYVHVSDRFDYVPVDVTFVLWGRTDLRAAARLGQMPLAELAVYSDVEREQRLQAMVLSAVRGAMRDAEQSRQDRPRSELGHLQDLLPLLPGLPPAVRLTHSMARELADTLPTIGVILNPSRRIEIDQVSAPEDIVANIDRDRLERLLRSRFPNTGEDIIVQALAALEGKDMPQIRHIKFDGAAPAQVDTSWDEERYRYRVGDANAQAPAAGEDETEDKDVVEEETVAPAAAELLTPDDLAVLKPVPEYRARGAS